VSNNAIEDCTAYFVQFSACDRVKFSGNILNGCSVSNAAAVQVFTCNGIKQGKELKVRVINYRDEENVMFGDEYKEPITCTQAIVVDADGNIGTLVFITETARDRFLTVADYCQAKKTPLPTQWLKIALEKTTSKEKGFVFHTPKIEVESSTKDEIAELIECIKLVPKCLNVFRELPRPTEK